jgi:hypothetical protein
LKPPIFSEIPYLLLKGRRKPRTNSANSYLPKVGCPIRKSADQSSFAAPHGLSQRSTSFIASQRQGIHQTPLRHLIALIINAHRASIIRKTSFTIDPTAGGQALTGSLTRTRHQRTGKPPATAALRSIVTSRCQTTRPPTRMDVTRHKPTRRTAVPQARPKEREA